jgi:hypothetical protein
MKTDLFQKSTVQPLILHGRKTTSVDAQCDGKKTKQNQQSWAKNMQSNGQPFKSQVFCRAHWALNPSAKG